MNSHPYKAESENPSMYLLMAKPDAPINDRADGKV